MSTTHMSVARARTGRPKSTDVVKPAVENRQVRISSSKIDRDPTGWKGPVRAIDPVHFRIEIIIGVHGCA